MIFRFEAVAVLEVDLKYFSTASMRQGGICVLRILGMEDGKVMTWFR